MTLFQASAERLPERAAGWLRHAGGRARRQALGRAEAAPQLLLDEPTSAVEPESEALIVEAIERLMQGRTTLVVSHRLSLARTADRVVVIASGRIAEQGPPDELLANPTATSPLWSGPTRRSRWRLDCTSMLAHDYSQGR
ncbi:MAG TPA: hypothetical protein VFU22_15140 [Roseiflexaceae bacterium]|nr:hypothetical protein [Roseiflexaceae bacterium]